MPPILSSPASQNSILYVAVLWFKMGKWSPRLPKLWLGYVTDHSAPFFNDTLYKYQFYEWSQFWKRQVIDCSVLSFEILTSFQKRKQTSKTKRVGSGATSAGRPRSKATKTTSSAAPATTSQRTRTGHLERSMAGNQISPDSHSPSLWWAHVFKRSLIMSLT